MPSYAWAPLRGMADKSGKKSKGKGSSAAVNLADAAVDLSAVEAQMREAVEALRAELDKFRVGKIAPALLDHVQVEVGGKSSPLPAVGQVAVKDAQTLVVTCFDTESALAVEKAVREAEQLKVTPARDGNSVRVSLPKATKEHRDSLVKLTKQAAENGKVRLRRVRQKGVQQVRGEAEGLSKDDVRRAEELVQALTDKYGAQMEQLALAKTKELLG